MEQLLISLISGAVGGLGAGSALKNLSLGTAVNTIVGLAGGAVGGQILAFLGMGGMEGLDAGTIATQAGGGVAGGAILMAVAGFLKKTFMK